MFQTAGSPFSRHNGHEDRVFLHIVVQGEEGQNRSQQILNGVPFCVNHPLPHGFRWKFASPNTISVPMAQCASAHPSNRGVMFLGIWRSISAAPFLSLGARVMIGEVLQHDQGLKLRMVFHPHVPAGRRGAHIIFAGAQPAVHEPVILSARRAQTRDKPENPPFFRTRSWFYPASLQILP